MQSLINQWMRQTRSLCEKKHEQTHSIQKVYILEHCDQHLVLDTHDVVDSAVMEGIRQAELTWQEQCNAFVEDCET